MDNMLPTTNKASKVFRRKPSNLFIARQKTSSEGYAVNQPIAVNGPMIINQSFRQILTPARPIATFGELSSEQLDAVTCGELKGRKVMRGNAGSSQDGKQRNDDAMKTFETDLKLRQAMNLIGTIGLAGADDDIKESFAQAESYVNMNLNKRGLIAPDLSSYIGPKNAPKLDDYRESNDSNMELDDNLSTAIAKLGHTNIDAEVSIAIYLHLYFRSYGRAGDLVAPTGLVSADASTFRQIIKHVKEYGPFNQYVRYNKDPRFVQFIVDGSDAEGRIKRSVSASNIEQLEEAYGLFISRCRDLGKEEAKKVSKETKLRRKSSRNLLRHSRFIENGMKERTAEVIQERRAEVSGEIVFMW